MQLLDGFFRSPEVEAIFSDAAMVQSLLDFEAALARAQARAGIVPKELSAKIEAACRAELFDVAALAEAMPSAGNVAIPLLKQLTAAVARNSPEAARYVHFGGTSQDALDTAMVLQLKRATQVVQSNLQKIMAELARLANEHRSTMMVARTWMQHALPTTFGYVTAGWLDGCLRHRIRIGRLHEVSLPLQFGGAVGTLAALHEGGPEVAGYLAEELRLPMPRIPWHAQRERFAEVATTYGMCAGTFAKIARDLSLYMQTEVAELAEASAPGRGGSSTMPHKRNPVGCTAVIASASRVAPLVGAVLSGLSGEYQRSLGAWQAEWELLPEIVRLTAGASHQLANLLPGLVVDAERMRANLELTHGLIYAEAVTMALSEKLHRASAHKLVEEASRRAQSEKRGLREVLAQDKEVAAILNAEALARLFEPANYLGAANVFVDRVLAAVAAPAAASGPGPAGPNAPRLNASGLNTGG